jgi:hypothetical protein
MPTPTVQVIAGQSRTHPGRTWDAPAREGSSRLGMGNPLRGFPSPGDTLVPGQSGPMATVPTPRITPLPSPTAPQITAAVAELRRAATRQRRNAGSCWNPHGRLATESAEQAAACEAVADWLATPIPAPEVSHADA